MRHPPRVLRGASAVASAVGATPRQLWRLVLGEALLVGTLATLPGGLLGAIVAATLSRWLAGAGLAAGCVNPPGPSG